VGLVAAKRTVTEGRPVTIDCPVCHASEAPAIPRQYEEPLLLLYFIPLFTLRSVFVECGACHQSLAVAARDLNEVYGLSRPELSRLIRPYVSGVGRFLVVSALLLFWMPFVAPPLALGGLWMTRRHAGWRRMAIIATVLSLLVAVAAAILIFLYGDA